MKEDFILLKRLWVQSCHGEPMAASWRGYGQPPYHHLVTWPVNKHSWVGHTGVRCLLCTLKLARSKTPKEYRSWWPGVPSEATGSVG